MNQEFQSHQGKQQFKIQSFLQGKAIKAKKLNNSFLLQNQRTIALLHNGMLVYFSKCFKSIQLEADLIKQKPKYGVYFNNVFYSCVQISEKEVELIVKFKRSQLFNFDDKLFSFVKDPKSQDIVLWIFTIPIDVQINKQNCDPFKGCNSLNSLNNLQASHLEEKSQKSNNQMDQKEKISIEYRINTTKTKNQKRVQWLDIWTQKQIPESNIQQFNSEQTTQNSKSTQQDDQLETYEEKTDLKIKNIEIRRLSFT
ncbi:unnamed protein product [Paramecium octaurelia]|uniref:Uncharacterized protein n=1 Tax=Paramecium octaurelia TaxID=43137 RepID=A0A8S1TIW5_PAROT|nr:unnamed protein product [Paramecium octaurelia]